MPISNQQWRIEVGKYFSVFSGRKFRGELFFVTSFEFFAFLTLLMLSILLWPFLLLITFPIVLLYSLAINLRELDFEEFITCIFIILCKLEFLLIFIFSKTIANHTGKLRCLKGFLIQYLFLFQVFLMIPHLRVLLMLCGDVESNPGPNNDNLLNLCHWNLNSLAAHDFVKLTHLNALAVFHQLDVICLSETFLDSDFPKNDQRLKLQGYELIRCDFPGNVKRGGVCVYHREDLALKRRDDLSNLDECLVFETIVRRSKCFISCIYRSPSDVDDEIDIFCQKFESTCANIALENPIASFILGDFNA